MAKPNALAMPRRSTAVAPVPMPPTTAAPQPKNTSAISACSLCAPYFVPQKNNRGLRRCLIRTRRLRKGGAPHFGPLVHRRIPFACPQIAALKILELFFGAQFVKKGRRGKAPSTSFG